VAGLGDPVAGWPAERRIMEAARMAAPKLPASVRAEFLTLFSGRNLVIMGVVFTAWAASHAFGIGEAIDLILLLVGLVMLGSQVWQCAKDLVEFVQVARVSRTRAELDGAATALARVIAVLGVTLFMALIAKAASRLPKGRLALRESAPPPLKRSVSPGGKAPARLYETLLPVNKVMEGDGALAQAMRKAALDDWYRNYPQLNKYRNRRASHLAGTNLAATVVRRELKVGTEIIQYQTVGRQLGTYLASPGTAPGELGILADARVVRRFKVMKPFEAVESTASPFPKGKVPGVGGKGGGRQLIMPPDWERYVRSF